MTPARPLYAPSIKPIRLAPGTLRTTRSPCAPTVSRGPASPAARARLVLVLPPPPRAAQGPQAHPENALEPRTPPPRSATMDTSARLVNTIATALATILRRAAVPRGSSRLLPVAASAQLDSSSMVQHMSATTMFFAPRAHTTAVAVATTRRTTDAATAHSLPLAKVAERLLPFLLYKTRVFPFRGWKSS